jgi:hypothetical protein
MKHIYILFLLLFVIAKSSKSQIYINGKGSYRPYLSQSRSTISVGYGSVFWNDSKQKVLAGSSEGLEDLNIGLISGFQKFNAHTSIKLGFEQGFSDKFSIKNYLVFGNLYTGYNYRLDLISKDKSSIIQLSTYGNLTLSQPQRKFKVHFLFGPEFMYVKYDVLISKYKENEEAEAVDYHVDESVFEVGLGTGLGFSYDFSSHVGIFTDGLIGISFPGGGLKLSGTNIGLKYTF